MRGLVKAFAQRMEARFAEKDGSDRCNRPVAPPEAIAIAMRDAAEDALYCVRNSRHQPHLIAQARKKAVDAANFAAILDAMLSTGTDTYPDETCESGCVGKPVVTHDVEGVPLCADCAIELLLEPCASDEGDAA